MSIPKLGPVIAIDGPAGTGKSSATKRLCEVLGFTHVDTGALYRALAYLCLKSPINVVAKEKKEERLSEARAVEIARTAHLEFVRAPEKNPMNRVFANGEDITDFIRTSEMSMAASKISAYPGVRAALLGFQRRLGCKGKTVLEGRDIGTVIFPDADIKFFLTATIEERAKRRIAELELTGVDTPSFEELKRQIMERDHNDKTRVIAPLKQAFDAILVDTSHLTLDQVVEKMEDIVRTKCDYFNK